MTRYEFYRETVAFEEGMEVKITTNDNEDIIGVIDRMLSSHVVIDETRAFGDIRVIDYEDIKEVSGVLDWE